MNSLVLENVSHDHLLQALNRQPGNTSLVWLYHNSQVTRGGQEIEPMGVRQFRRGYSRDDLEFGVNPVTINITHAGDDLPYTIVATQRADAQGWDVTIRNLPTSLLNVPTGYYWHLVQAKMASETLPGRLAA